MTEQDLAVAVNQPSQGEAFVGQQDEIAAGIAGVALSTENEPLAPPLDQLRGPLRGKDEAVQLIGTPETAQRLESVLTSPGQHTHDELLDVLFSNFSGEAFGDMHWPTASDGWGSPEVVTEYGKLRQEHPEFAQLSLDPGFMTHLPEFVDMLGKGEITATDSAGARAQLKEKLGDTTVWRGVTLTDEELALVKEQGMVSALGRTTAESEHPVEQFEATALSAFQSEALEKHFHNEHRQTPFISVTENKDIAIAVGRQYGSREEGKKLYLFQLKVPTIDVVSYTEHALRMPSMLRDLTDRNPNAGVRVTIDGGEPTDTKWTEGAEHYAFWKIDPENIIEITQPEVTESTWNGKVTRTPVAA